MAILRFLVLIFCVSISSCLAGDIQSDWYGQYNYSAGSGSTAGGSPIWMDITLIVDKQGTKNICQINADGYQTYDRLLCTVVMGKDRLILQFKSYEDGAILSPIGVEVFKVGETLFSLEKTKEKNKKNQPLYLVHWGVYFSFEKKGKREYFAKVK